MAGVEHDPSQTGTTRESIMSVGMLLMACHERGAQRRVEWRPRPELNWNRRFRKPLLYPFELRGQIALYQ